MLRRWLAHAGADDLEIAEITTACGEAATNAIEHAGTVQRRPLRGSGRARGHEVEIAVHDHGSWRTERKDDHGRGLDLMRTLMDTVAVEPGEEGTMVSLRRRLGHGEVTIDERLDQVDIEERGDVVVARLTGELDISVAKSDRARSPRPCPARRAGWWST